MLNQISGHPHYPVKLTHKINRHSNIRHNAPYVKVNFLDSCIFLRMNVFLIQEQLISLALDFDSLYLNTTCFVLFLISTGIVFL